MHMLKFGPRKVAAAAVLAVALLPLSTARASNDWVETHLRTDLSYVNGAMGYYTWLDAAQTPPWTGFYQTDFTYGWLGVFPAAGSPNYFVQIGLITDINGVRWAAESLNGQLSCPQGGFYQFPGIPAQACFGSYNSLVGLNQWEWAEIYYQNGLWNLEISGQNGCCALVVGQVSGYGSTIYGATQDGEEGYTDSVDPYVGMYFWHYHPQYATPTAWVLWPASPSQGGPPGPDSNKFYEIPSTVCPAHYGGSLSHAGDPRYWYAGTGASTCATTQNPITQF
jgi:hypothetical protein